MLNEIKTVLAELKTDTDVPMEAIFYGVCTEDLSKWNYFVFNRVRSSRPGDAEWNEYYTVNIIHEDYVPEGYVEKVIKAIKAAAHMRVSGDVTYAYVQKSNTQMVVEVASIVFVKNEKAK